MKNFLVIIIVVMLSGCSSFGRGIAEAFLDKNKKEDTRRCEIKGDSFRGINYYLTKGNTVKVLMIHGVGTHQPGYSTRIRENLAKALELNVFSKHAKDITLLNPTDGKTEIGNLRAIRMQNSEKTKDMIFYELTWSQITTPYKEILDYDVSGEYIHKRAAFNNSMKKFLDDTVPDPMIYLIDGDSLILNATKQSTCWMLSKNWEELKNYQKSVCTISSYSQIENINKENIIYITHSLGSRILMDSLIDIVNSVAELDVENQNNDTKLIIDKLQEKQWDVFMMANQLPLLQIGRSKPGIANQVSNYCSKKGKNYNNRVFKKTNIVAFSDPNDLLSYDVPQSFTDQYMDSRMCPVVSNVSLNVAEEISAFGIGVVNPVAAHTLYDNDERVVNMIANGAENYKEDNGLNKKCTFIKLED